MGLGKSLFGQSLSKQLAAIGYPRIFPHIVKVFHSGHPYETTLDIRRYNNTPDWLKLQVVRADDYIVITLRDISARFSAQRALEKSEEKYRRLVDGLHRHFIYTKNQHHIFDYVSAGTKEIFGIESSEFCEKERTLIYKTPARLDHIRYLIECGEKPRPYVVEYLNESGQILVIEYADTPVFDENQILIAIEGIARDVTEERALQKQVYHQANHDQLTGLLNRYAFDARLKATLEEVKAASLEAVLCYVDMDRFKLVNDSCGHPAGDRLLKEVSQIFEQYTGDKDTLARVGGDEFCFIFKNKSLVDIQEKLDSLKNLEVEYVKIDGSFVKNMCNDAIDFATVTAINNIAQSMGKKTVAEFVADIPTADALRKLKVDYGQGFALGKPVRLVDVIGNIDVLTKT